MTARISEATGPVTRSAYRRPLAWAGGALLFDSIVAGAPSLGFLTVVVFAARHGILAVHRFFRKRAEARAHTVALAFHVLAGAAIMAMFALQGEIGRSNAERIIAGVDAFRAESGRYPDSLAEITPTFLPEIPPCAWRLVLPCAYSYRVVDDRHILGWIEAPPYGSRVYVFETREWRFVD